MVTGVHADTDMVTTMDIVMATIMDIVLAIVQDTMRAAGMLITGPRLTITGQRLPTICTTIALGESEVRVAMCTTQRQATGWRRTIVPDPQHSLPTGPTMSIRTGMAMCIGRMEMTLTG